MDVLIERCAGLDVHKRTVVATIRSSGPPGCTRECDPFVEHDDGGAPVSRGVARGRGGRARGDGVHGVYWRPVYAVLAAHLQVRLVNPRHVKHVPGRKTDVRDSEWLAQLLECGLLKASFIPPPLIRDLRDLTRYRKVLIRPARARRRRSGRSSTPCSAPSGTCSPAACPIRTSAPTIWRDATRHGCNAITSVGSSNWATASFWSQPHDTELTNRPFHRKRGRRRRLSSNTQDWGADGPLPPVEQSDRDGPDGLPYTARTH